MTFSENQLHLAFTFFTRLRESGAVNMWLASDCLARSNEFTSEESDALFFLWKDALTERDMPIDEQVAIAIRLQREKEVSNEIH